VDDTNVTRAAKQQPELRIFGTIGDMPYPTTPSSLRFSIGTALLAAVLLGIVFPGAASLREPRHEGAEATAAAQARLVTAYGQLPLLFERNEGQTDPAVDFLCRAGGMTLWLAGGESVMALQGSEGESASVVRMRLVGAAARPLAVGEREQASRSNYLLGAEPAQWHTGVANFYAVRYRDVYPGIDLVYHGDRQRLEYDFAVAPGARAEQIRLRFSGAERVEIGKRGELLLHTRAGMLTQETPVAWQEGMEGWTPVAVRYAMASPQGGADAHEVLLVLGERDRTRRLVIDPVIVYGTYLGGMGDDYGNGIAVDGSGNAYFTGSTRSTDFPTSSSPLQASHAGGYLDAFVTKLDATGSSLVYSTYLGGGNDDFATGIAIDASGNAYVTGSTFSMDFPTSSSAFQTSRAGETDVFVTKLDAAGSSLVYSTYLGGGNDETGQDIAVDDSGSVSVTGTTFSTDFPTSSSPLQASFAGVTDAFVTKLDAAGASLVYSTFLGGVSDDDATGIAVDASGYAYVTGSTLSTDFPTSSGPLQASKAGGFDAFVTKLDTAGSLVYSTYVGGASNDDATGIAVDVGGNAYVTGYTTSTDFPTTSTPLQASHAGGYLDAFVTKLDAAGSSLVYSTYLGGASNDQSLGIAVDGSGNASVTGFTESTNFPIRSPLQASNAGLADVFITKLGAAGSSLVYSTYLGGASNDRSSGIAVDLSGNTYVTGVTFSTNFPTSSDPVQASKAGLADAFAVKLGAVQSVLEVPTLSAGMLALLALALAGVGAAWLRRSRGRAVNPEG